jgi:elongation factor Ts
MAEITAALVKQLRERTGAGMMECKSALVEANGDLSEAEVVLRKRGLASAAKKASRSAKQGLITVLIEGAAGAITEINCESDFVARTEDFQSLTQGVTQLALSGKYADLAALLAAPFAGGTVEEAVKQKIAKLGENITVTRFARLESGGVLGSYIHTGAQLGVLIDAAADPALRGNPEFSELLKDLAMQVAAADPRFVSKADVTAADLEKERDIQRARALAEGKPEKMVDKIVEGRMQKFYEEVCLLEQPFIKDNAVTVAELIKSRAAKLGAIGVNRFVRFKVGETQPADAGE